MCGHNKQDGDWFFAGFPMCMGISVSKQINYCEWGDLTGAVVARKGESSQMHCSSGFDMSFV